VTPLDTKNRQGHHDHVVRDPVHSPYFWRDLQLSIPDGLDDDTLLTFSPPDRSWNLTVTEDALDGTLEAYVRTQEQAFAAHKPPGYAAQRSVTGHINGHTTITADRTLKDARGEPLVQRQIFVALAARVVVIVTVTAPSRLRDRAHGAAQKLVSSLARRGDHG
jgi:hypothetical protein